MTRSSLRVFGVLAAIALFVATPALGAPISYSVGPVTDISASCSGQNAEVEQAVDTKLGYVYEDWMGCHGIGFARSTDGGLTFEKPIALPGTVGSNYNVWDPAAAVAPDGTVYAAFMRSKNSQWYPFVAASFDSFTGMGISRDPFGVKADDSRRALCLTAARSRCRPCGPAGRRSGRSCWPSPGRPG